VDFSTPVDVPEFEKIKSRTRPLFSELHEQDERRIKYDGRLYADQNVLLPEPAQSGGIHQHQQRGRDFDGWCLELRLV